MKERGKIGQPGVCRDEAESVLGGVGVGQQHLNATRRGVGGICKAVGSYGRSLMGDDPVKSVCF